MISFSGSGSEAAQGVVCLSGVPLMTSLKQIWDNNRVSRGYVVTGCFIDHVEMERIFKNSGVSISVSVLNEALLPDIKKASTAFEGENRIVIGVIDDSTIAGYLLLKDPYGKPSSIIRAVENRSLYEQGKSAIRYIFMAIFATGSVLCCVLLFFVRGAFMSRLQSINARVSQISAEGGISARLPYSARQDEFNDLVGSINSMLDALEKAETSVRESEERYRLLFERAPDAIIIIGVEGEDAGRIIAANQAAADQHGYSVEELCRLRIYDLNTDETNRIAGEIAAAVVTGEWVTAEVWHRKKDGSPFPIEVHAGVIKIGGNDYILGFDRDITQRKIAEDAHHQQHERIRKLNDELNRKALELAAANDELETFNYSVSHDMRGPLTRISGYCQLLLDDGACSTVPHCREYITRIYESEIWLNEIIDALLNLAQLTRVEIVASPVNLSAIAEAVLSELALEFPARTVATRVEPEIIVSGDARLLKMVMVNLLGNSWKYSLNRSEALIEFGVNTTDTGSVYFVHDNGAGFDMKDADKLFRAFTRLHDTSKFEGSGIGLATVQRIIARHGGEIWAEAVPDAGATFYFTLSLSHST